MGIGLAISQMGGTDPVDDPPPISKVLHRDVAIERIAIRDAYREGQLQGIMEQEGFNEHVKGTYRDIVQQFKQRGENPILYERPGMSDEELVWIRSQWQPLEYDPNRMAQARAVFAKVQERYRREVDPKGNLYADPRFRAIVNAIVPEGMVQSGEQQLGEHMGAVGRAAQVPFQALVAGARGLGESVNAIADLGQWALHGMSGGRLFEHYVPPTQRVQAEDGKVYDNGGKVQGGGDLLSFWETVLGESAYSAVKEVGELSDYHAAQAQGFEGLLLAASGGVGTAAVYGGLGGAAGAVFKRGLGILGSLGAKAPGLATRAPKIVSVASRFLAPAAANAAAEALTRGRIEGYGAMAVHGLITTPLFVATGLVGRRTEAFFQQRNVPRLISRGVAGVMEGLFFTPAEALFGGAFEKNGGQELWEFLKEPSAETWGPFAKRMAVNALTFGFLRGAARTPSEVLVGLRDLPPGKMPRTSEEAVQREVTRQEVAERQGQIEAEAKAMARTPPGEMAPPGTKVPVTIRGTEPPRPVRELDQPKEPVEPISEAEMESLGVTPEGAKAVANIRSLLEQQKAFEAEREQLEVEKRELKTDPMTGLNAPVAFRRAQPRIDSDPSKEWVFLDNRGQKEVNDLMGTKAGDDFIARVAEAVHEVANERGIELRDRFRAGGDETGVAVPRGTGEAFAREVAARVGLGKVPGTEFVYGVRSGVGKTWDEASVAVEAAKAQEKGPTLRGIKRGLEPQGRALIAAEGRIGAPLEERRAAAQEADKARQELAGEAAGLNVPRDVAAEKEARLEELKAGEEVAEKPMPRRFPELASLEGVPGTEPVRAADAALSLQGFPGDMVRSAHRAGRLGMGKRTLGWFSNQEALVRSREARALDTRAHEFAHDMQATMFDYRWVPKDQAVKTQLLRLARDLYGDQLDRLPMHRKIREGWAEFWARDLWGDATLKDYAPDAHAYLKAWMSMQPKQFQKQYQRNQALLMRYRDQGAVNELRMAVVMKDAPISKEMKRAMGPFWKRAVEALDRWTDDVAKSKQAQRRWFDVAGIKESDVPITWNVYRMLSVLRGAARDVADAFLWRTTLGVDRMRTGEGLKQAFEGITREEMPDFAVYAYARRSLELMDKEAARAAAEGRAPKVVTQHSREVLLTGIAKLGNARFEKAVVRMKEWSDRLIDYAVQSGSISEETGQAIKEAWAVYIPFFRAFVRELGEQAQRGGQPQRGVAERGSGVGRIEGSTLEIRDPLQAMMEVTHSIIQRAHQAQVVKALYTLHLAYPKLGGLINVVLRDKEPITAEAKQMADALKKIGINVTSPIPPHLIEVFKSEMPHLSEAEIRHLVGEKVSAEQLEQLVTFFRPMARPTGSSPIIAHSVHYTMEEIQLEVARDNKDLAAKMLRHNGKLEWLELDPDMFESVMGLDLFSPNIPRAITTATDLVKIGATGIDASFALVTNLGRDVMMQPLFTESPSKFIPLVGGIIDYAIGGWRQIKGRGPLRAFSKIDPIAQMLEDSMGGGHTYFKEGGRTRGPEYRRLFRTSPTKEVVEAMQHPLRTVSDLTDGLVSAMSGFEKPLRVREGTFVYKRAIKQGKSHLEAVFEAQEADREITQNFLRSGATIRAASRFLPYLSANVGGKRKFVRALLGRDGKKVALRAYAGGLYGITSAAILNWFLHSDEDWYEDAPDWEKQNYMRWQLPDGTRVNWPLPHEYGKLFGAMPMRVMSMVHGKDKDRAFDMLGDFVMQELRGFIPLPAVIGPSFEVGANWSSFTGREIVPQWMIDALPPGKRAHAWTTWLARTVGETLGVSPIKVEYWLNAHTGGLGLSMMRAVDDIFGLQQESRLRAPTTSQEELAEMPLVGVLFKRWPHRGSAAVDRLYEIERELRQKVEFLSPQQEGMRPAIREARERISAFYKAAREGRISREEADRQAFKVASRIVPQYERITQKN